VATIDDVVARIERTPDCSLLPPAGEPQVLPGRDHRLPDDMRHFYRLCGGARIYASSAYGFSIVGPPEVAIVDLATIGKVYESDISASWYIAAMSNSSRQDLLSIDMAPDRLGRCYLSFFEYHRNPGDSPIVATSFTDLLERLLNEQGRYFHWWEPGFESLGDAYDGYEAHWVEEELKGR